MIQDNELSTISNNGWIIYMINGCRSYDLSQFLKVIRRYICNDNLGIVVIIEVGECRKVM